MTRSMSFAPIAVAKSWIRFRMRVSVTSSCVFLHVPEWETNVVGLSLRSGSARSAFARSPSPTRPFDSARNPAEINSPLMESDVDRGQREIRRDKQKNEDPDRNGPRERMGFRREPGSRESTVGWPQRPRHDDERQEHQRRLPHLNTV